MKESLSESSILSVRQESWIDSPCSFCHTTPCCKNLPLTTYRVETRFDFIQLCLLACYENVQVCLKSGGSWSVYYQKPCTFLNTDNGKCGIHGLSEQSMICKDYDAHKCWYSGAFQGSENKTMVHFDLERLIWFGHEFGFFPGSNSEKNDSRIDWNQLVGTISSMPLTQNRNRKTQASQPGPALLRFSDCSANSYLLFPLLHRPENKMQFELLRFRLGFPNMFLAVTDNSWCYMLKTCIDEKKLRSLRMFFPGLLPDNNPYCFGEVKRKTDFRSYAGEAFVLAALQHITGIEKLCRIRGDGSIPLIPKAREILKLVKAGSLSQPDRIA